MSINPIKDPPAACAQIAEPAPQNAPLEGRISASNVPTSGEETIASRILRSLKKDECNPLDILDEARDVGSPVGRICLRTLYQCIPQEWFSLPLSQWPNQYYLDWKDTLKSTLLLELPELGMFNLQDVHFHRLIILGITHLKMLLVKCSPEARLFLALKQPPLESDMIRANFEKNPLLDVDGYARFLDHVRLLFPQKQSLDTGQTIKHISFLKQMCCYTKDPYPISIENLDSLFLFISLFNKRETQTIYEGFLDPSVLREIDKAEELGMPLDSSVSSQFIRQLHSISQSADKAILELLLSTLSTYAASTMVSMQPPDYPNEFLTQCGDTIYGLHPLLNSLELYTMACKHLNSFDPLTSHHERFECLHAQLHNKSSQGYFLTGLLYNTNSVMKIHI